MVIRLIDAHTIISFPYRCEALKRNLADVSQIKRPGVELEHGLVEDNLDVTSGPCSAARSKLIQKKKMGFFRRHFTWYSALSTLKIPREISTYGVHPSLT
ncbi:hypothetical protein BC937DRAFT_91553 [Endogone sp. FLAS-F59071]|nr:hypothetical protein BC937DRAFT_91553 [Endogone sp. FLAS-F59071]|eukprot:RUS16165.1 hypothetical protein BC937DRAFT_91553 [Endogone sp. FLAS-F59071]